MQLRCRVCRKPKDRGHIRDVTSNQSQPTYSFYCLDCCPPFPPNTPSQSQMSDFMERMYAAWWDRFTQTDHYDDILDAMDHEMLATAEGALDSSEPDEGATNAEPDAPDPSIAE